MNRISRIIIGFLVMGLAASCAVQASVETEVLLSASPAVTKTERLSTAVTKTPPLSITPTPERIETTTTIPALTESKPGRSGELADQEEESILNPLTGLPVSDPDNLMLPPVMVSISNSPKSARPQSGLSYCPLVFEMYIGVGVSRFLSVFYGEFPESGGSPEPWIGPIRSGRIPYEYLRQLYDGHLVFASASTWVYPYLDEYTVVYGTNPDTINSAGITASDLKQLAENNLEQLGSPNLSGLTFEPEAPGNGKLANQVWIAFQYMDQILWKYDPAAGAYARYQENQDGTDFELQTDRLTNQPISFENIVFMFADHHFYTDTFFDIDLMYITKLPALLFRDGQMYEIFWTTGNQEYEKTTGKLRPVRFIDQSGEPFPLKNGQTWIVIVPRYTPYNETVETGSYFDFRGKVEPGSGNWAVQFYQPVVLDLPPESID